MLKEFAEFKSADKTIKICVGVDLFITGKILEISPEFVLIDWDGKPTVVQTSQIKFFQEA